VELSPLRLLPREAGLPKNGWTEGEEESRRVVASRWGDEERRSSELRRSEARLWDLGGVDMDQTTNQTGSDGIRRIRLLCGRKGGIGSQEDQGWGGGE
jgi:hypothetical protein